MTQTRNSCDRKYEIQCSGDNGAMDRVLACYAADPGSILANGGMRWKGHLKWNVTQLNFRALAIIMSMKNMKFNDEIC